MLDQVSRLTFEQWLAQRYEAFRAAVYRRWGEDGEDALQDCLLKISAGHSGSAKFTSVLDVEKWLWRCVRNGVIARIRRKLAEALGERDPSAPSQPSLHDFGRLQRVVCACYRGLNQYRKDVLRKYYLDELSVEEIASQMHLTKEAVKAVLFQARRQLRECLEGNGVSYEDMLDVMLFLAVFDCENNPPPEDTL